jgi:hypothetical protein
VVTVRRAAPEDIGWLLEELVHFSKFFNSKHSLLGEDAEYSQQFLSMLIEHHLFLVSENDDGERTGFIAGFVHPHVFNPKINVLTEVFWWVAEPHRQTRAGLLLLEEFIKWGREHTDWIVATIEDQSPVNEETFLRRGFRLKEKSYIIEN